MPFIFDSFVTNMLNGIHVCNLSWPVHNLYCHKCCCVTFTLGRGIVLDIHRVSSKKARRPKKHITAEKHNVALMVDGPIQHHQLTTATKVDGTPYHDWGAVVTGHGLDTRIYQSLPLPAVHMMTNSVKWDSSPKTHCPNAWGPPFCAFTPTHGGHVWHADM